MHNQPKNLPTLSTHTIEVFYFGLQLPLLLPLYDAPIVGCRMTPSFLFDTRSIGVKGMDWKIGEWAEGYTIAADPMDCFGLSSFSQSGLPMHLQLVPMR